MEINNPLEELKDVLVNMRSALTLITEAKLTNLETIKHDFQDLVNTAEKMNMEKMLLDKIEQIKSETSDVKSSTAQVSKELDQVLKGYL